jgi:hypothetical protein
MDNILLWLWLSQLLLLWLSRLLLLGLNKLRLLWLHRLLLLARGTTRCQLSKGKMTSNAIARGMMNVNHLQFRDSRVQDSILNNSRNKGKGKIKFLKIVLVNMSP